MKLFEWHIALANSLGDPVVYDATGTTRDAQLVGNVRYSAANRESYLQRAMAKIHSDALAAIAERSRSQQVKILQSWFPTSTVAMTETADDNNRQTFLQFFSLPNALYVYSLAMRFPSFSAPLQGYIMGNIIPYNHFAAGVSVPILPTDEAYRKVATRGIGDESPYAYVTRNTSTATTQDPELVVYIMAQHYYEYLAKYANYPPTPTPYWWQEDLWLVFEVTFLPKAPNLNLLPLTDVVQFEPFFYDDAIIRYATMYGQMDSQEISATDNAVQLLFKPHFVLEPNMPGGNYGGL